MKTYKTIKSFCQSILFLLFLCTATLQKTSAQLQYSIINDKLSPETFYNRVGADKEWLIILTSALISFFLIARLIWKYMKKEFKQLNLQLSFPLTAAWFLAAVFFYLPLNTLYMNFDDFYTRLRGQEYTAVADYGWETIKVRSGRTSYPYYETVRRYSFTFVADNGVTTSLDQGLANFSEYDNAEQGDKFTIKYLPQAHKLSIVNKANDYDNLLAMGVSILLLILLVALLTGKLNFLYTMWRKFRERRSQKKQQR